MAVCFLYFWYLVDVSLAIDTREPRGTVATKCGDGRLCASSTIGAGEGIALVDVNVTEGVSPADGTETSKAVDAVKAGGAVVARI